MSSRQEAIKIELKAYESSNSQARYQIKFRGQKIYLPVITVNPNILLLNNKNNRLTGQLYDHPKKSLVESNLESPEAQQIISTLLSETDKFKDLKQQLATLGQEYPGLITRDGLLVNGNTRVVALRELGKHHVDVAVLPENITDEDVLQAEMTLQSQELVHQDYTFTNELLLMQRFFDAGGSENEYAERKSWVRGWKRKVKQQRRILGYIEEVRQLSSPPVKYSVFDSKQQHLKDLDNDYIALKDEGDIDAAESLKWTRLSMLFLGLNKDQIRAIDDGFVEDLVLDRLKNDEENEAISFLQQFTEERSNDGLDDLLGEPDRPETIDMRKFLEEFLSDSSEVRESSEITTDENSIYQKIQWNARRVAEKLIDEQKLKVAKAQPSETLKDVRASIVSLREKLPEILTTDGFKKGQFEYDLRKVKTEIEELEKLLASHE